MDLGIKELGITFMVGAFTILGFELILYHFFSKQLTGFFQGRMGLDDDLPADDGKEHAGGKATAGKGKVETKDLTMKTAVFIGLAFAVGVLAEDLSYKYVDSIQTPFKTLPAKILPEDFINTLDLPSKYDSRIKTLIDNPKENPTPQWLTIDLARDGAFSLADPEHGLRVEKWILDPNRCKPGTDSTETCPSFEDIKTSILRLYYYAKNRVYAETNYYDEMKKIQTRLEFSRSISMIAFVYFVLALLMVVPLLILSRRKSGEGSPQQKHRRIYFKAPAVLLILFFVFFFSVWAYERESDEFNKRAFGYFSSMLLTEKHKQAETNKQGEPNN